MTAEPSMTISRMTVDCQVPAVERGREVETRLRRLVHRDLENALAECLGALKNGGETLIHIKRLELDLNIDLSLSEGEIARVWAGQIKNELLSTLRASSASGTVLFASLAHYLRGAVQAMVRGRVQQLWYFREFRGLWALPTSAAVRTALLDNPTVGLEALIQLRTEEAVEVCAALTASDAQQLLEGLMPLAASPLLTAQVAKSVARSMASSISLADSLYADPPAQVLFLAISTLRSPGAPAPDIARLGAELLSLLMQLRHNHPASFHQLMPLLSQNRPAQLKPRLAHEEIAALLPLINADEAVVQALAEPLQPSAKSALVDESETDPANGFTWFGNALLLLPEIGRLPLSPVRDWPTLDRQPAERLIRWLVLCVCQGSDKFYAALQDPFLRTLCGLNASLFLPDLVGWLNARVTERQHEQMSDLLEQQCAKDALDLRTGAGNVEDLEAVTCARENVIVTVHREKLRGRWARFTVAKAKTMRAQQKIKGDSERDARQQRLQEDLAQVWLSERHGFRVAVRALLANLAQFTLSSFAYRLPGFAGSSLPYVWRNFLGMSATLVAEDGIINAYLSRVPMGVMLNMAGINRGTVLLPDFDQRPIRLLESA